MQGMNPGCAHFNDGLKAAMAAIICLNDHGALPLRVELGDRRPVITIVAPRDSPWLRGAMKHRSTSRGLVRTVMAMPFHGCQLEWACTEASTRRQVQHA